jgi:hypothetical protein
MPSHLSCSNKDTQVVRAAVWWHLVSHCKKELMRLATHVLKSGAGAKAANNTSVADRIIISSS